MHPEMPLTSAGGSSASGMPPRYVMERFSARTVFEEISDNDEASQLFCSVAVSGEAQGGWGRA
jgi:hypothetical protein